MPNLVCGVCGSKDEVRLVLDRDDEMHIALCKDCRIDLGYENDLSHPKSRRGPNSKMFVPLDRIGYDEY